MHRPRILILHPDPAGRALLAAMLESLGHGIEEAADDRAAARLMERRGIDLVLAGIEPADGDALEWLAYARREHREVPVVLLFPRAHPDRAREALRRGAMAVLEYPAPAAELRAAVLQALDRSGGRPAPGPVGGDAGPAPAPAAGPAAMRRLEQSARDLGLIGHDPTWRQVIDLAGILAATRAPVLITGEPGTGKSLVARLIHSLGPHPDRPFVTVDAPAMADGLAIREAAESPSRAPAAPPPNWSDRLGQARGGTLYLDEVAGLPIELQLHLLRELRDRDLEATAARAAAPGHVRYLMSTGESLPALIERGRLLRELCHRIGALSLTLPPLRHRGTDIELLAVSFRARYARESGKDVAGFTGGALDLLGRHDWPGNVRELEAAVRRAVALCTGPRITASQLAPLIDRRRARAGAPPRLPVGIRPLREALEEPEKRIIIEALRACGWRRQEAARALDIDRVTLYKKMNKYKIIID
jgi:two-component system response regulator HydG